MPPDFNPHCALSSGSTRTAENESGGDDEDEEDGEEDCDEDDEEKDAEAQASTRVEKGGVPSTVSPR